MALPFQIPRILHADAWQKLGMTAAQGPKPGVLGKIGTNSFRSCRERRYTIDGARPPESSVVRKHKGGEGSGRAEHSKTGEIIKGRESQTPAI